MPDIVLDSNILSDFLAQYYDPLIANRGEGKFCPERTITKDLAYRLNHIIKKSHIEINDLVVSSTFAFIEIARKWDDIVQSRFSVDQMYAFISQPPDWFDIAPVDEDLLPFYLDVPTFVFVDNRSEPIDWTDAIHVATAYSRGEKALLATTDHRLKCIGGIGSRLAL
jgi:predicted nucleic acid-binding protein